MPPNGGGMPGMAGGMPMAAAGALVWIKPARRSASNISVRITYFRRG